VQVIVPPVSLAAVLQGTALTVCVETPSGATLSKPGPVSISGKAVGCKSVPRRALAAGGPYRLTPSCRSQQKQHLYDLVLIPVQAAHRNEMMSPAVTE